MNYFWLIARREQSTGMGEMLNALRERGALNDALHGHISPLGWNHIGLTGDYNWHANKRVAKVGCRPCGRLGQWNQRSPRLNVRNGPFLRSPQIAQSAGRRQTPIRRCSVRPCDRTVVNSRRFYPQTWCCAPARRRQLAPASQGARAHSSTLRRVWKAISMEAVKWSRAAVNPSGAVFFLAAKPSACFGISEFLP